MDRLFTYLLQSGVCLTLFYAVYWLFLRRETFFTLNRFYLLTAASLSFLLPLFKLPSPFLQTVIVLPSSIPDGSAPAAAVESSSALLTPLSFLLLVYLCGVAFLLVRFFLRLANIVRTIRTCGCRRQEGLRLILCPNSGEPFSFFHYVFLDRTDLPDQEFNRILSHELVHVRQLHSLDIIFSELTAVIQWFNPFVWPYKRSLRETHEYLADRAVIAQGCSRTGYQLLILEQQVGGKLLEVSSHFRNSQIKRRLNMLSRKESKGLARLKPLLLLPLALVLVLALAEPRTVLQSEPQPEKATTVTQASSSTQATSSTQEKSEDEIAVELKQKAEKLAQLKQKNEAKLSDLKALYNATEDPAKKEELLKAIKEQKIMAMEIEQKAGLLHMKKLELALAKETDSAKRDLLKKKLQSLRMQSEDLSKKLSQVEEAEQKASQKESEK
jgi:hypothetical protein